ncbi:dihydrodipicolinate reductase [Fulvivirga sp. RKSG066]|uniref:NAD(P)H-dependent amine dehydrogenase family protein n=1 Tax=Fulvivirga aurantia TaxID=2529383 RepID=UPI0012BCA3E2|nr:dihydrodipicolinate reductase [Fulvivirga aurantia]MTI21959.1 dihydrodipicolinate reductase [Fulvivirga aurantia]
MGNIRILQVGLGPLGIKIAEFIAARNGIETVAAVDKKEDLIGLSLSEINADLPSVEIQPSVENAMSAKPDVAILTTVSDMARITDQVLELVANGIPVVSTCEELSHPWSTAPKLAEKIDLAAKENNVAVVGTGVNPGFLMDSLPTFLTSVCQQVDAVEVSRYQNASFRRVPFREKIGAGITLSEFEKRKEKGLLRHVGLTESIQFIASNLGWKLDKVEDLIMPVIAEQRIEDQNLVIEKGNASGVRQVGTGYIKGKPKITLTFQATIGEPESYDEIKIKGSPNITSKIEGGVNGDVATCAIAINATKSILKAQPGLRTMADIPMPSYFTSL